MAENSSILENFATKKFVSLNGLAVVLLAQGLVWPAVLCCSLYSILEWSLDIVRARRSVPTVTVEDDKVTVTHTEPAPAPDLPDPKPAEAPQPSVTVNTPTPEPGVTTGTVTTEVTTVTTTTPPVSHEDEV